MRRAGAHPGRLRIWCFVTGDYNALGSLGLAEVTLHVPAGERGADQPTQPGLVGVECTTVIAVCADEFAGRHVVELCARRGAEVVALGRRPMAARPSKAATSMPG